LIEDSLGNLKSATEQNISQTAHGLDKLYIRLMAFMAIPTKLCQEKMVYLKPVRILSDFISYLSDSNVFVFKRSDEVEQLLLESVLENHNLLAIPQ
jgi:hypothetical protein